VETPEKKNRKISTPHTRYRSLSGYLTDRFGERVHKIAIDAGLTCPNRDGTISRKGCIFCNSLGSGTGASLIGGIPVRDQVASAMEKIKSRFKAQKFIAYFQSFSNTNAPVAILKDLFDQALISDSIVGLSVATRPDCVEDEKLKLLASYSGERMVWLELGLQSAHDITLKRINRGHDVACFEDAVGRAKELGLSVVAHVILGLPGETKKMMLETARFLSSLPIEGVKIHHLYVVRKTLLAELYEAGKFSCLEQSGYVGLLVDFIELLRDDIVVHRLTGDPHSGELMTPLWSLNKSQNIGLIHEEFERRNTWQGKNFSVGK